LARMSLSFLIHLSNSVVLSILNIDKCIHSDTNIGYDVKN